MDKWAIKFNNTPSPIDQQNLQEMRSQKFKNTIDLEVLT